MHVFKLIFRKSSQNFSKKTNIKTMQRRHNVVLFIPIITLVNQGHILGYVSQDVPKNSTSRLIKMNNLIMAFLCVEKIKCDENSLTM